MHVGTGLGENRSLYRRKGFDLQRCENKWTLSNPFPYAYIVCPFPRLYSHATTRFQDQNPYNANKTTFQSMDGGQLLLLPQCVQVYCIAGLIHPAITSVWTDGAVWLEWCGKRPKPPNSTNKTTSESRAGNCSPLSQCVQYYWVAGLNHAGRMSMWTVRVIWHIWCWKRRKTPNNTNKTTFKLMISNGSFSHTVFSPNA